MWGSRPVEYAPRPELFRNRSARVTSSRRNLRGVRARSNDSTSSVTTHILHHTAPTRRARTSETTLEDPFVHVGPDGEPRCWWTRFAPEFIDYHDREWGYPVADDIRLFEKMSLESFQSGLSWRTILNKRDAFRQAFDAFDFGNIATYGPGDVERLLANAGIVRHRGKIEATIHNAAVALELVERYGSLAAYVWRFEPRPDERPERITWASISAAAHTQASKALSRDLKRHGWRFFGPTTAYAFMEAMGLVNDHQEICFCRQKAEAARAEFEKPT